MTHPDEDASTRGLSLLVETQPSDYFTPRNVTTKDSSKLVLCCLWEALVAGKLIDVEDQVHKNVHVHHNVVLYQLLDVFDAGAANGIPGIVLDTFREVQPEAIVPLTAGWPLTWIVPGGSQVAAVRCVFGPTDE